MRVLSLTILILLAAGIVCAAQPDRAASPYQNHMLVRVIADSKQQLRELYSYSSLDVVGGDGPMTPFVVAVPQTLTFLAQHGFRYEIVRDNLEQFYAQRLISPYTTMGGFRTFAEIQTAMDSIHTGHPGIATAKWSIGSTGEGRAQYVMEITNLADSAAAKPEVFYNSMIHAREPEAMECLFYFMNWLTDNYGIDTQATYLVNNRKMFFLPCVNPDGYEYNRSTNPGGGGMWRKNRRNNGDGSYGVDLNRNFDAAWGIDDDGSSPITSDDTYRGPSPFSEPETQHLRDFINAHHFVTEMDYHTYQDDILIPWGTSYYPPPNGNGLTADDATYRMICDSMNYFIHSINGVWYATGTAWEVLYNTNGGSFDWEYGDPSHQKIFALTTEVGNGTDGFWPSPSRILPLAQENFPSLVFLARVAGPLAPLPYKIAQNGQCETEWNGNGNSLIEPGEGFTLTVNLKNVGTQQLTGITGQITTSDPYVSIVNGSTSWPTLAADQSANSSTVFQINAAANCPNPHLVALSLHVIVSGVLDTTVTLNAAVGYSTLSDNVEAGAGAWTTGGTNNQWHISTRRASSATHAWFCGAESGNYADAMSAYLQSATMILGPGAEISYDQYYALENTFDFGYFEINTGSGWTNVGTRVTGNSGGWLHVTQTLPITCAGTPTQIRFRMSSDANTNAEGWYIDNISTGCPIAPAIAVTPNPVNALAAPGGTDSRMLHICNTGGCQLTWSVTFTQTTPASLFTREALPVNTFSASNDSDADVTLSKDDPDSRRGGNQLDSQGGPDAFGYRWKDSHETDGPVYNWVDVRTTGTRLVYTGDDQSLTATLPWSFPFYGTNYTTAHISANGNIHFSADTTDWSNQAIPGGRLPNAMLAPFWDDLSPQLSGGIYYYNDVANNRFIVQYDSVPHYTTTTGRYTFEVFMYNTGRIVYQYKTLTGALNTCTVGIENSTGTVGLQVLYNAAYLTDGLAIEIKSQILWLSLGSVTSGALDPGACTDVTLNFTSGSLAAGTYNGQLAIANNDPAHNPLNVPVTFTVGQPTLTLAAPNGGETWLVGSSHNITWSSQNLAGNVNLDVNRNYPSGVWESVVSNVANTGSYPWTVTGPGSAVARLRVVSVSFPAISDLSDAAFTIQQVAPQPPTDLTIAADWPDITLRWRFDPGAGIQYEIFTDTTADGPFTSLLGTTGDTTFVDAGALNGSPVTRFYFVRAVNFFSAIRTGVSTPKSEPAFKGQ